MLIALSGLPGCGKTTLARELVKRLSAVHLRVDTIEQALIRNGLTPQQVGSGGYVVAYAIASENLAAGLTVIADSVNPLAQTRSAWRDTATRTGVRCIDIELVCSDRHEHRRRVESRVADIAGHRLPSWHDIDQLREVYLPWPDADLLIDTAASSATIAADSVLAYLAANTR